jgi:ankyrin repeat protein
MVKLLTTKAKIEKTDRYKRTALTHATMNGSASVVSYLLSRGANPNRADTSGLGFYIFV